MVTGVGRSRKTRPLSIPSRTWKVTAGIARPSATTRAQSVAGLVWFAGHRTGENQPRLSWGGKRGRDSTRRPYSTVPREGEGVSRRGRWRDPLSYLILERHAANVNSLLTILHPARWRNQVSCRLAKLRLRVWTRATASSRVAWPSRWSNSSL